MRANVRSWGRGIRWTRSRSSSTAVVSTARNSRYDLVTIVWATLGCSLRQAVEDASCARELREFFTTADTYRTKLCTILHLGSGGEVG
jgi:hypothetical protein